MSVNKTVMKAEDRYHRREVPVDMIRSWLECAMFSNLQNRQKPMSLTHTKLVGCSNVYDYLWFTSVDYLTWTIRIAIVVCDPISQRLIFHWSYLGSRCVTHIIYMLLINNLCDIGCGRKYVPNHSIKSRVSHVNRMKSNEIKPWCFLIYPLSPSEVICWNG